MAFNDIEFNAIKKEVKQFVESIRPPVHIRSKLDIVYSISDQTVEIGQLRPVWRGEPGETHILPNVRIRYVRSQERWKLYWMRKDLKWHLYSTELSLTDALELVRADPDYCFFG